MALPLYNIMNMSASHMVAIGRVGLTFPTGLDKSATLSHYEQKPIIMIG
jgi:hypothetical protein